MGAQPTMDDIAKIKAAWDRDIAEWKAKVQRLQAERDDLQRDVWKACADSLRRHHAICDQRDAALDQVEALKVELAWIGAFAQMRSADDSKTFAKVNRGALRTIAEKALAALSAPAEERSSSSAESAARRPLDVCDQQLRAALEEIRDLEPREKPLPADHWEQIKACPECQRYADHPVQRGICNEHRRPMWDRENHEAYEERALGYRMKTIARDALAALTSSTPSGSQPPDMRSRDWRTLWDAPIDGTPVWTFGTLHDDGIGERAGLFRGWFDAETNGWVCKELGGYAPAFWAPDHAPAEESGGQPAPCTPADGYAGCNFKRTDRLDACREPGGCLAPESSAQRWRAARVGRQILIVESSPESNAIIYPDVPEEGCYWSLIGCGSDEAQNALAQIIADALNAAHAEGEA